MKHMLLYCMITDGDSITMVINYMYTFFRKKLKSPEIKVVRLLLLCHDVSGMTYALLTINDIICAKLKIKISVYFVTIVFNFNIFFRQICSMKMKTNRWIQRHLTFKK